MPRTYIYIACLCIAVAEQAYGAVVLKNSHLVENLIPEDLITPDDCTKQEPKIHQVTEEIHVTTGYSRHGNTVFLRAPEGVIMVRTSKLTDTAAMLNDYRKSVPNAPLRAVVITDQLMQYSLKTQDFAEESPLIDIWAPVPSSAVLSGITDPDVYKRQHGLFLDEMMSGLTPSKFEDQMQFYRRRNGSIFLQPSSLSFEKQGTINLAGLPVSFLSVPSVTTNNVALWIPSLSILISNEAIHESLASVYGIERTPVGRPQKWASFLDTARGLRPEHLISGHVTIQGSDQVYDVLTTYRDALHVIHDQAIRWFNKGIHREDVAQRVTTWPDFKEHAHLQALYETIAWSAKTVVEAYTGWFSSYAEELFPLSPTERSAKSIKMAGGCDVILRHARYALARNDNQWALELSLMVLKINTSNKESLEIRKDALRALAEQTVNPIARKYYLSAIFEHAEQSPKENSLELYAQNLELAKVFQALSVNVDGENCGHKNIKLYFNVSDTQELYLAHLRNGILETRLYTKAPTTFDAMVITPSNILRKFIGQLPGTTILNTNNEIKIIGARAFVDSFFSCFDV